MCFQQSQPVDHSAELARQEEQARKGRILQGQGKIDSAFGMFDEPYFDHFKSDYLNYYTPQVDKQFGRAKQDLSYDLARKGVTNSTPGNKRFADLIDMYGQRRNEVASNALSATAGLKTQVEANKSELYNQNTTSADPSLAAQNSVSRVNSLTTPPVYSPLADLFAGAVNGGAQYLGQQNRGLPSGYAPYFAPGYYSSSSGRVVT